MLHRAGSYRTKELHLLPVFIYAMENILWHWHHHSPTRQHIANNSVSHIHSLHSLSLSRDIKACLTVFGVVVRQRGGVVEVGGIPAELSTLGVVHGDSVLWGRDNIIYCSLEHVGYARVVKLNSAGLNPWWYCVFRRNGESAHYNYTAMLAMVTTLATLEKHRITWQKSKFMFPWQVSHISMSQSIYRLLLGLLPWQPDLYNRHKYLQQATHKSSEVTHQN